ncbi:aminotransferase class III-fold pyridoxal phosphate-dependent enzyme [Microbacterium sp. CPCC 204701]|uniref:aminotransferase class III-fold pyridoxal phosphate-dependent enzyme n=1 Tax=Microbacterium sp. CPCC 204701 TaxID=2493084 RepID=UPI000FD8500B|nr:aminotransferase class III-fold pyridoxal phosphate-dependent enzyme [Microbacterium sp. CPCC 204701]
MSHLVTSGLHTAPDPSRRIVGGEGVHLHLADGTRLLDASNTGAPLGHGHPAMVEALREAAAYPVVNEGHSWAEREDVADELVATAFGGEDWVGGIRFGMSGSEVNDIALSLAQSVTGRAPVVTRERAYHGLVGLSRDVTVQPQWHGGLSALSGHVSRPASGVEVRTIGHPGGSAYAADGRTDATVPAAADLVALEGAAAVIVDYTQGGFYYDPAYQDAVAQRAQESGALWIADEVVTGLGRSGRWMQFTGAASRPDIVTLGKPLAGGAVPAGAVVLSKRVLEVLETAKWQNYSTFRAHPVVVHAIRAHLRVAAAEGLPQRAVELGAEFGSMLADLGRRHPSVTRVAGNGLHWTVELPGPDWRSWRSTSMQTHLSDLVVGEARMRGVQISTSDEPTSLFLAPPLIIERAELERIVDSVDAGLTVADRALEEQAA